MSIQTEIRAAIGSAVFLGVAIATVMHFSVDEEPMLIDVAGNISLTPPSSLIATNELRVGPPKTEILFTNYTEGDWSIASSTFSGSANFIPGYKDVFFISANGERVLQVEGSWDNESRWDATNIIITTRYRPVVSRDTNGMWKITLEDE